ncbi:MAG: hypothetical protein ABIG61_02850 [Planctomycetota bacterium]
MLWRSKLFFLAMAYFAGFATAVYNFEPGATHAANEWDQNDSREFDVEDHDNTDNTDNTTDWSELLRIALHKFIDFVKYGAQRLGTLIMEKVREIREEQSLTEDSAREYG